MTEDQSAGGSGADAGVTWSTGEMRLTDTQRQILTALCRPRAEGNRYATPATNQEIAGEVFLSVDAVKAHLRALYRKFGVEPLPHNQKRARLVELVLEGGLIAADGDRRPPQREETREREKIPEVPSPGGQRRPLLIAGAAAVGLIAVAAGLAAILSGGSNASSTAEEATPKAEYVAAVNGYCRLALAGQQPVPGANTAQRARTYLNVIETMRGRLASIPPPAEGDRALDLFELGLGRAADFTSTVAQDPPTPGSGAGDNIVAGLTLAAGQVQAGALRYRLGPDCSAIGDLVARSARNAAGPP